MHLYKITNNIRNIFHNQNSKHTKGTIIFWVPGGMQLLLHVEGAIAQALRWRGYKVHAIICDGPFRACAIRQSNDNIPISDWAERCSSCRKLTSTILRNMNIPYSFIGDYIDSKTHVLLWKEVKNLDWNQLKNYRYKGVNIGKNIQSSIIKYLKGKSLTDYPGITKEYVYSGLISAASAEKVLCKFRPDRIFMSHGIYVDWGPALNLALSQNIPVTGWVSSYLPARFYFRNVTSISNIDFHGLNNHKSIHYLKKELTKKQSQMLKKYINKRYKQNYSFDMKEFKKYSYNVQQFKLKYHIDKKKPVWGIMAHVNWDAVSEYSPMIYDTFENWILDTIKEIISIKDVEWIIKAHPAEVLEKSTENLQKLIKKHFSSLPPHIHILPATEDINPLNFIQLIDGGITAYGTLGLEVALMGKPVILTGVAHYAKKGFTYDCKSIENYKKLLNRVKLLKPLTKKKQNLARRYAYNYFIQRQIPFPVVKDPNDIWWHYQADKKDLLKPNRDPFVGFICDRIIDGKDFIMDEKLVELALKRKL